MFQIVRYNDSNFSIGELGTTNQELQREISWIEETFCENQN